jgi:uncharacterized protein (TIGR03084 family)
MGVRMFTTARQMETWAHGQAIYDLMGTARQPTDRLRNIAEIGVRTYGWTFANRAIPLPGPPPYVRLTGPSGAIWEWNDPSSGNRIEGSALDFCQVVTQVRNIADTALVVTGEPARRWMSLAQCFAGSPEDPPRPGARFTARPIGGTIAGESRPDAFVGMPFLVARSAQSSRPVGAESVGGNLDVRCRR